MRMELRIAKLGLTQAEMLSDRLCKILADEVRFHIAEERAAILEIVDRQRREYESLAATHASERGHTVAAIYAKDAKTCEHLAEAIRARGEK